jgi:hypothetical protein
MKLPFDLVWSFARLGRQALTHMAIGADPSHGGQAGIKRRRSNSKRARERAKWQEKGLDEEVERERFSAEIFPLLKDVPLRSIAKATGLSLRYASMIRRGDHIPHPVHYAKLASLVELAGKIMSHVVV